jgi:V-type H+-transporting ATPase subunit a
MFGDIGHGIILLTFGLYLIFTTNKHNEREPLQKCRYLITLMGFFAIFCGFIYNDFMSLPLNMFGSCYNTEER